MKFLHYYNLHSYRHTKHIDVIVITALGSIAKFQRLKTTSSINQTINQVMTEPVDH